MDELTSKGILFQEEMVQVRDQTILEEIPVIKVAVLIYRQGIIKKFDLRKRHISLTLEMLHNFLDVVTEE